MSGDWVVLCCKVGCGVLVFLTLAMFAAECIARNRCHAAGGIFAGGRCFRSDAIIVP